MVYRIFVERKEGFAAESTAMLADLRSMLGISSLEKVRVINRYDVENISPELLEYASRTVFSEPQSDTVSRELHAENARILAVEYLPGQFDQRADSAAQCIQILSQGERPLVRTARVFLFYGTLTENEMNEIRKYVINPVEAREASLELPDTLQTVYEIPTSVETVEGFCHFSSSELEDYLHSAGFAMDLEDLLFCQEYFLTEKRDPTITELRMIDTYWSDHCRHTTFLTTLDHVFFEDPLLQKTWEEYLSVRKELNREHKPVNLMDLGTIAAKALKKQGKLDKLDESEEINACTVKITVSVDGKEEPWLLLFKNETHNHPTEIEPFGGAATCIGGAIRDPLSGRSYVYGAMRLTGAGDPLTPMSETMPGKLPQKKIVTTAAAGYSSYGNQIGLATGMVDELYHPGYTAKRMEVGAVVAAAPAENVRRETPQPEDVIILLGGRTGRDGCGGATGSSKSHTLSSLESCGAEVQKGNAPEERKLQRLFRNPEACRMIKRCNDFGAGGVSVAIGELADGLDIDLNAVPRKYEGLDGTELAISESQERMAIVVAPEDTARFLELAASENLEATVVATVTASPRLVMHWNGKTIVDISREFLNSNGAEKHADASCAAVQPYENEIPASFKEGMLHLVQDLNVCSKRGLSERFDSTIGAATVLMPFGGKRQQTPIQAMVQKISVEKKHTDSCSVMSWGCNPYLSEKSPYHGAFCAVVDSASKLVASGAAFRDVYLSFQEYFQHLRTDPERWGQPLSALLGAFRAQMELGIGAIGGKDSMSGSFENLDVPPTLISFAVTTARAEDIVSNEFKKTGSSVYLLTPSFGKDGLPESVSLLALYDRITDLFRKKQILSAYTPGFGGTAEAIFKMCLGNGLGFSFSDEVSLDTLFRLYSGAFVVEAADGFSPENALLLGVTTESPVFTMKHTGEEISLAELQLAYEEKLESVYPAALHAPVHRLETITCPDYSGQYTAPAVKTAVPKVLIPVFPGTNCEYDSAKAMRDAGAEPEIMVINNLSAAEIARSTERFASALKESQMVFIPGGFSGGDEPDGSGKFITAFFRNAAVKEEVTALMERRDGLMLGICNGFQALIKLGLVPYGKIIDTDASCPTLTFNTIGRHQSRLVRVRVSSNRSPWLAGTRPGEIYSVPISHGEGRFIAEEGLLKQLIENGQIATQYVDEDGYATDDILCNPNNSMLAVEGICSPDGRVFGKMGHAERIGSNLYKNVPGEYDMKLFTSAVKYFK